MEAIPAATLGKVGDDRGGTGTPRLTAKFVDTEFVEGHWRLLTLAEPPTVSGSMTRIVATGSSAGAARSAQRTTQILGGPSAESVLLCVHLNTQATYDPRVDGTIVHVDFAADVRTYTTEINTFGGHLAPALQQGRSLYVARQFVRPTRDDHTSRSLPSAWKEILLHRLRPSDFWLVTGPTTEDSRQNPDFSSSAPPIVFGYMVVSTHTSADVVTRQVDVDTWSVAVYGHPPSTHH